MERSLGQGAGSDPEDPLEVREREALAAVADAEAGSPLHVHVTERRGTTVVRLEGELDLYTAPALHERLVRILEAKPPAVVVDLSSTSYIDSSGLAVLLRASRALPQTLAIVTPRERVTRLFEVTGLAKSFSLHRTLPEALDALAG